MKGINYWEQFMATGKIEDFLAYKNAERQENRENREAMRGAGEDSDAGGHGAYRDGAKG